MEESTFVHKSVLLYETVGSLNIKPGGLYVDGTLGGGGHAYEVCKRLGSGKLIGIDQDADAIEAAGKRLLPFQDKVTIVRSNYANIKEVLKELEIEGVDGIYLDLGVSSYQLDTASRGFTYREDAPLDMRMDQRNDVTAAHIINTYSEMELYRIIRDYGEDNFAKNIAKHIVRARGEHPIETTGELAEIIKGAIPARVRATGGHPAKRTFQAIRIECNHELEVLEQSIDTMIDLLNPGGRLSIITFHSLEDRIVKSRFRLNENPCICPHDFLSACAAGKARGRWYPENPYCRQRKNWRKTAVLKAQSCASLSGDSLSKRTRPFSVYENTKDSRQQKRPARAGVRCRIQIEGRIRLWLQGRRRRQDAGIHIEIPDPCTAMIMYRVLPHQS